MAGSPSYVEVSLPFVTSPKIDNFRSLCGDLFNFSFLNALVFFWVAHRQAREGEAWDLSVMQLDECIHNEWIAKQRCLYINWCSRNIKDMPLLLLNLWFGDYFSFNRLVFASPQLIINSIFCCSISPIPLCHQFSVLEPLRTIVLSLPPWHCRDLV